jgi:5-hydroxyisourate hydrolase
MPPSTTATQRITALSQHLTTSPNPPDSLPNMSTEKKPPITCHILDTSIGKPAHSIPVTLTLLSPSQPLAFTSTTTSDGRVTSWTPSTPFSTTTLEEAFKSPGDTRWSLKFDTESYFKERGVETFFPEVEVKFVVREAQKGEHFHVPVLVGGFGYSTYRGS